jgi:hypothetical protein
MAQWTADHPGSGATETRAARQRRRSARRRGRSEPPVDRLLSHGPCRSRLLNPPPPSQTRMPQRTRTELPPRSNLADLADERDDAAVVRELQAAPAPARPIGREHRFAVEAGKRPAVTRGNQPQLPGATHSVADAFAWAASTSRATMNQGKSSHARSFARGHKKTTRPTREFGKSSPRAAHLTPSPCGRRGVAATGIDRRVGSSAGRVARSHVPTHPGSAQADGELRERVVDREKAGSGDVFDGDPFRERNLGRPVRARRGVLFMRVIFPLTRRVAITSGELRTRVSTAKTS